MNMQRLYGWMAVVLATTGAIGWNPVARAGQTDYDLPMQTVKFADLNLGTTAGATTLYRRIESAAERVCGSPPDVRDLTVAARVRPCKEHAIERAVNTVNATALTSLHLARTGRAEKPITLATVSQ